VFTCQLDELRDVFQRMPLNESVAFVVRHTQAEFTSLSAEWLRQLIREHPQERVVVAEENDYYVIRLVPPLVHVRECSDLFAILKQSHRGGVHIFDKSAIEAMLDRLRSTDVAGDLMTKNHGTITEDVTAGTLLGWLLESERVRVSEQDRTWYMLEFGAPAERGVPRFIGVRAESKLVPELKRLQLKYSTHH
jgi:hypothetical protein